MTKEDEELVNMMNFYDYIEVQPISACTQLIGENRTFKTEQELQKNIEKIIRVAASAGKPVCATSDAHHLRKDDKIYREIIINQKFNGRLHPLNRKGVQVPDMHLLTTREMLDAFSFLNEEERHKIVVTNPSNIADMVEEIEVIIETGGIPFAPIIENSQMIVTDMVYEKAKEWYGDPLPYHIEERIALELYGASLIEAVKKNIGSDEAKIYAHLHDVIRKGPDSVEEEIYLSLKNENKETTEEELKKEAKKKMTAIIGANFDVIYLISQKLVKHSNDEGFLVGSRGSVGSSFVANLMGITEVNSLAPHYRCPKCKRSEFNNEAGEPLGNEYKCGYDLPDRKCPTCNIKMVKEGQDIPFQTFLGFNADKVPDIDLNFSDLNQASAHDYTKVLFGVDNVYRAGTIGTVAEKTAYGYVRGYCEDKSIIMRNVEIERLAKGCTGVKRTTGQHPGGIVVIPGYMEVSDFTPFQFPAEDPNSPWRTTHFDYHAIDECVLKLDILGHTDPTQLRMIQDLTGEDVRNVPLDDKETMSIFTSTKALGVTSEQIMCDTGTLGVPEFGTPFTIQLVKDTKPKTFAELIKISGLSHGTDVWLGNAQELIQKDIVPFGKVIGCRDDIMVELMYGGLEPFKAFKIMEFVRKGKASKDPETWQGFVEIMEKAKIPDWFIKSCFKIKYMFPKAHAAAYVMSAFRIAWFKVHKPNIYYATYFSTRFEDFDLEVMMKGYDAIRAKILEIQSKGYDATNKEQAVLETLKLSLEATARGFRFGKLDINKSDSVNFLIDEEDDHLLIPPFRTLDGLGDAVAKKIIEERNQKPFYSVEDFQMRGKVNATTIEKLRSLGLFEGMPETSQLSFGF
ncbi:MAG: PolC-type DNA polymerase III [Bacilli bacterium]|nr:PolC-type DNA polymerase III [Bacilli bacterium]